MNITYACPNCDVSCHTILSEETSELLCPWCQQGLRTSPKALVEGRLAKCLVCPSTELFVRKDFPQRLGVTIVGIGLALSCVAWFFHMLIATFAILFATALVDLALFVLVGDLLECYRCHAQYRGTDQLDAHGAFDLETHEKHRQTQARLSSLAKEQG